VKSKIAKKRGLRSDFSKRQRQVKRGREVKASVGEGRTQTRGKNVDAHNLLGDGGRAPRRAQGRSGKAGKGGTKKETSRESEQTRIGAKEAPPRKRFGRGKSPKKHGRTLRR